MIELSEDFIIQGLIKVYGGLPSDYVVEPFIYIGNSDEKYHVPDEKNSFFIGLSNNTNLINIEKMMFIYLPPDISFVGYKVSSPRLNGSNV